MAQPTHGLVESEPPQTPCGLSTTGVKATSDPFRVTCEDCLRVMGMVDMLPNMSGDIVKNRGGRPAQKRSWF
jgi:hypothetical protein